MKRFRTYLDQVGLKETQLSRVEYLYGIAEGICPESIERVFVDEYIDGEGRRVYGSLWFFSKNYCMEAKSFITDYKVDITPVRVIYFLVDLKNYDFKKATPESRLNLTVVFAGSFEGNVKASKENCDSLRDIILNYIKPHLA